MKPSNKENRKVLRKARVRSRIEGSAARPRLSVFRGVKTISLQLIDDTSDATLASAYERELSVADQKKTKTERANALGKLLAKKALAKGITSAVFDRGASAYHGRVQAVADGAREEGLTI